MPGGDGTGPGGMGPMTGRAAGFCAGYQVPGYMNPVGGRGYFGMGRGGGWGRRNMFYATGVPGWARGAHAYPPSAPPVSATAYGPPMISAEQEPAGLKQQAMHLQTTLEGITSRIEQLETESKS